MQAVFFIIIFIKQRWLESHTINVTPKIIPYIGVFEMHQTNENYDRTTPYTAYTVCDKNHFQQLTQTI